VRPRDREPGRDGGLDRAVCPVRRKERQDLDDLVEWIGISYFAIAQVGAAVERAPHLKAIVPFELSADTYEAAYDHGLLGATFITSWLTMIGVTAPKGDELWRGRVANLARRALHIPTQWRAGAGRRRASRARWTGPSGALPDSASGSIPRAVAARVAERRSRSGPR
jgi:predicted acyl esterase